MTNAEKKYRGNVAAIIVNGSGRLLACRRADEFHTWQLPQGGIDSGEHLEEAVLRELREEIGTDAADILFQLPHAIRYDWPEDFHSRGFHGQEQHYFLLRLKPAASINLNCQSIPEFDAYEWLTIEEFLPRLSDFKRQAYTQALRELQERFPELLK